jgi:hypothetical protein
VNLLEEQRLGMMKEELVFQNKRAIQKHHALQMAANKRPKISQPHRLRTANTANSITAFLEIGQQLSWNSNVQRNSTQSACTAKGFLPRHHLKIASVNRATLHTRGLAEVMFVIRAT